MRFFNDSWAGKQQQKNIGLLFSLSGENQALFNGQALLIDSTKLPSDINFQLSAVENLEGVISNEARLVYAIECFTKMPIYFI
jgi:hypothetical protein